ncbi:MAG: hypothetical protein GWM92_21295, partial [Gemmatimonadetes bacterium]|nr:hypothetical protein [Gemmatimonadota bacterium]NIR81394.1 hypothetical protein [Gemmatimonadota bacterium]NIT90229.1 hypothetical protein [Gemmatimonadota bacterium]NIU34057.1 hypothetical protein [Gemmatimonadota bacterium]NIU38214.1 hypothetical protein [Gemmatimonadota bacterium]
GGGGLGGELSIQEVIRVELTDLSFSADPGEITDIRGGSLPGAGEGARGSATTENMRISRFFSFGGSLTVMSGGGDGGDGGGEIFTGGVDRFVFYRAEEGGTETTHIIIRRAHLSIQDGEVLTAEADFIYDELVGGGFHMALGATAEVVGRTVNLVGFMEKTGGGRVSAGMFVAAEIQITVGYVTIERLGGGFFWRPRREHVDLVYSALDVTAGGETIRPTREPDPGRFAVFLYGELSLFTDELVRGSVLLTITARYFSFDAEIVLLDQDPIGGSAHLTVGFADRYVEGNVRIRINLVDLVEVDGGLEFYAYGRSTWGVLGEAHITLVSFINIDTQVFFGDPGFVADFEASAGFDVWVISVKTGIKTTLWFAADDPKQWGAYVEFYVHAKILKGIVAAKGTLRGALVLGSPSTLYAGASLSISVIGISWSGSVWMTISSAGLDAGLGSDPALEEILARADEIREEITSARDRMEEAIAEAKFEADLVGLTREELEAAYARITEDPTVSEWLLNVRATQEHRFEEQGGERAYMRWFIATLLQRGAPDDRAEPLDAARELEDLSARMEELRPRVQERLGQIEIT